MWLLKIPQHSKLHGEYIYFLSIPVLEYNLKTCDSTPEISFVKICTEKKVFSQMKQIRSN